MLVNGFFGLASGFYELNYVTVFFFFEVPVLVIRILKVTKNVDRRTVVDSSLFLLINQTFLHRSAYVLHAGVLYKLLVLKDSDWRVAV